MPKKTKTMKKIILMTFAILSCGIANAQNQPEVKEDKNIEIIPQIGLSSSNYYSGDTKLNNSAISGLNIGVGLDYYFNDRWSLRSGLFYQKMGSTYSESSFKTSKDELFYLTIPINANWHFGSTRKWNLNFGPSIGFLTSAKYNGIDVTEYINSTQIGFNYGIGYKITVSDDASILLDYQGMSGLTDVVKDAPVSFRNAYGTFNIGVVLKL